MVVLVGVLLLPDELYYILKIEAEIHTLLSCYLRHSAFKSFTHSSLPVLKLGRLCIDRKNFLRWSLKPELSVEGDHQIAAIPGYCKVAV